MPLSSSQKSPASSPNGRVVLVEDEAVLREELAFQLRGRGFDVVALESAEALYRYLAVQKCAVVLLDIGLPGESGLAVCRYLRAHDQQMGILFLTARSLRDDRLVGLAAGADAYLVKPVDIEELVLTVQRLGRRSQLVAEVVRQSSGENWSLADGGGFLYVPNGQQVRLSMSESLLLQHLFAKQGEVCVYAELSRALGELPEEYDKHRLEVLVSRLRAKVLRLGGTELPLESVRGQGYCLQV